MFLRFLEYLCTSIPDLMVSVINSVYSLIFYFEKLPLLLSLIHILDFQLYCLISFLRIFVRISYLYFYVHLFSHHYIYLSLYRHPPISSFTLDPNIYFGTLFPGTLSLCSTFITRSQFTNLHGKRVEL